MIDRKSYLCVILTLLLCGCASQWETAGFGSEKDFDFGAKSKLSVYGVGKFKSYGIDSSEKFDVAIKEMNLSKYSDTKDPDILLSYLADRKTGQDSGVTAVAVKENREAEERKAKEVARKQRELKDAEALKAKSPMVENVDLVLGQVYFSPIDGDCTRNSEYKDGGKGVCVSQKQYDELCRKASGITRGADNVAKIRYLSSAEWVLFDLMDMGNYTVSDPQLMGSGQCYVYYNVNGVYKGNSYSKRLRYIATSFLLGVEGNGQTVVHGLRHDQNPYMNEKTYK